MPQRALGDVTRNLRHFALARESVDFGRNAVSELSVSLSFSLSLFPADRTLTLPCFLFSWYCSSVFHSTLFCPILFWWVFSVMLPFLQALPSLFLFWSDHTSALLTSSYRALRYTVLTCPVCRNM